MQYRHPTKQECDDFAVAIIGECRWDIEQHPKQAGLSEVAMDYVVSLRRRRMELFGISADCRMCRNW